MPAPAPSKLPRLALRGLFSALFVFAGVMHFAAADVFVAIMPPYLPPASHRVLVAISGACEIAGGLGILAPVPLRRWAGWGLILLLIAVFPANVQMALARPIIHGRSFAPWLLYLRLPLQAVLIYGVYWAAVAAAEAG